MQNPTARAQDIPQTMAVESILDMDPGKLAKEFENFSFIPNSENNIYTSSNSDPLKINFKTLSTLERDQTVREIESVKKAFYSLATSVQKSKISEILTTTKAIPVQVERLYKDLNREIKNKLSQPKYITLNTDPLAKIFIGKKDKDLDKEGLKDIEALATSSHPETNIDKAKLLIYGQLIDKIDKIEEIEEIDSHKIKEIYDKILDLKFKEVTLKKFLPSKEKTPAKIDVKTLFAETPISDPLPISQPPGPSPLSILLQTSSFDTKQKKNLDELKAETAESIFPKRVLDPQPDSQSSGAPPLPTHVAIWAKSCLVEKQEKEASWKMQAESIKNNSEIEALQASKAEAIDAHIRLEVEISQIRQELEEIEQRNEALSDSIPLDNPNLEEVIAREEELKRVLEEKQKQENIIIKEAWRIQQELIMQKAIHGKQNGEIPGLRPGQKPEIATTQIHLQVPIANTPFPNSNSKIKENISQTPWYKKYLANLGEEEPAVTKEEQEAAQYSLQPKEPYYSPFPTLSGLPNLGVGPFALGLGNTQPPKPIQKPQAPVQGLSSNNQTLTPTQTSLQHLQANAITDRVAASSKKLPAETSAIFMLASHANIVTNENPENRITQSVSDVDQLLENLSAAEADPLSTNQLLVGLQSEDLTNLNQSIERENQILKLQQTQPNQYSEVQVFQLQNTAQINGELGSSAQQSDVPPPPPRDESQTSSIDEVEENILQPILRTQEEKQFWQTFISTRLREKPSNPNQNLPGNNEDDLSQDELFTGSNPNSPTLESGSLEGPSTPRSTLSDPQQEEEIEKRKKGLYAILMDILKNQSPIKSESGSKDGEIYMEEIYIEEGDKEVAKDNLEAVMAHIANYTLNLLSSISQTEGAPTSEAFDTQITQNSSNDDPIIYSGIGIRIKLEKEENGECSLKITEVFENSGLHKTNDVNKKITQVECEGKLKSITAIYEDCKGYEEKFYNKISVIFRDENQEKLTLKIDDEEKTVGKNIFIPEDKKGLNIYDNSQMTKIAEKLKEQRQTFGQLSPKNLLAQTA